MTQVFPTMLRCVFSLMVPAVLAGVAHAGELGNVKRMTPGTGELNITTNNGFALKVQVLDQRVFRIWAGPDGKLEPAGNNAAPIVLDAKLPNGAFNLSDAGDHSVLSTDVFALRIYKMPLRFALYRADNQTQLWNELKPLEIGVDVSVQTLSSGADEHYFGGGQQNGNFEFRGKLLEISYSGGWEENDRPSPAPFYMSNIGYGVLRNTWTDGQYDFRSSDYLTTAHKENRFDAYYFVGDSIHDVLPAYTALTGRAALLPRWAFEYGDADCYNDDDNVKKPGTVPSGWSDGPTGTTADVLTSVAAKYREHDMPGGWILPNDGYGCAYTDLPRVVEGLKKIGFHTGLWTENGVDKIAWEVGTAGSRVQKLDVAWTGKGYQFALDANQAAADGILKNSDSRPFLWTVMGWAGIQRYAVTWTGDQSGSWDYIRWHIATLIGSGLSGQMYATGDVDGIFGGSPETYTRDLQWKAFTPVLMGMSGWSSSERKHPWWFAEPYRSINRDTLKLRMRLMPYLYTLAWQAETTGAPIVRGLMWDHPDDPYANNEMIKNQFFLGRDLLIAPVFSSQAASHGWRRDLYLPQGQWIDYWDGTVTKAGAGGVRIDYPVSLEKLPVLVRAGAIIPMYPAALYDGQVAKDILTLDIYPFGHSEFTLYEDDGNTRAYQKGAFSQQRFSVGAAEGVAGAIKVSIGAVQGQYTGLEENRTLVLQVHTRVKPESVWLDGAASAKSASMAEFESAASGWFYNSDERYGVVHIKIGKGSVRQKYDVQLKVSSNAVLAETKPYPGMPALGNSISADQILVLNRPLEESGHALELAFDDKPETWFRTRRDESIKTGPHEFVLAFGERRMIAGFEIAPRNDKNWQHGQVRDYEVYLSDRNGDWGEPVAHGALTLDQGVQHVEFAPRPGRLLRFRVLSVQDPEGSNGSDPMVIAARNADPGLAAFIASQPDPVTPISISEFHVLQHPLPDKPRKMLYLSDATADSSNNSHGPVKLDVASSVGPVANPSPMTMNGLKFRKGLGVNAQSRIDYTLDGDWQTFRADIGIDDTCRGSGSLVFQVFGDDRLLYRSGVIAAPVVLKPELDVRGVHTLSLRTESGNATICGNWANAGLSGFEGDTVGK